MARYRRGRRPGRAAPLQVVSGEVILLTDFLIGPQGPGMIAGVVSAASLPPEAMYYARHKDSGQLIYMMPVVREKMAKYQMSVSPDPSWRSDPSYTWAQRE